MTTKRQPSGVSKSGPRKGYATLRFGGKLDLFMLEHRVTNEGMAAMAKASVKTVSRVRAGRVAPSAYHFVKMLEVLGLWTITTIRSEDLKEGGRL